MDAIIISGYLNDLSDNIIPFIKGNDLYVHTWDNNDNSRWIKKLQRYKKYTNNFSITTESPKYDKKFQEYMNAHTTDLWHV